MKKFFFAFITGIAAAFIFNACTKVKDLPFYDNGTPITLSASATAIAPAPADSANAVISFSWTNPAYASDSGTFKYVLEIDSSGRNFADKVIKVVSGTLSTSLTGKELNAILLNYGFSLGSSYDLDVRVVSSYANNNEQLTSNVVTVAVVPYGDSSVLTSSVTSVVCDINTASEHALDFSWSASFSGYKDTVTYTLQYDSAGKGFAAPFEILVGGDVYTKAMTQGEMNETALDAGIPGGNTGDVEYRIKATTALGATTYSNAVVINVKTYFPLLRFYMPGSYQTATGQGTDWTPTDAPELIRDLRPEVFNDMYYIYIYLRAGEQFKITQGRSWDINYGGTGGTLVPGGDNLSVSADGFYRISINRKTLKYDIREGRMGFVGAATGAGWEPGNVFPTYAMGAPATNLFVGITGFTQEGWKLIDNNQWNDGSFSVVETRSYGSDGGSGSTMQVNGPNFPNITTAGTYRVIWDGRNRDNIKYEMSPAAEMRVVGDGIEGVNDWDPPSSPQMTYKGNGIWQITLTLKAGKDFKFVAGNAWGAFDYEDNSGQSNATGVPRSIKWDGSDNFKTPAAAGSYTITLDEYKQTVLVQ